MFSRLSILPLFLILIFSVSCSSGPSQKSLSPKMQYALTFIQNIGAGELAMKSMKDELHKESIENPEMAELFKGAMGNIKQYDFELLIAEVYARHLSETHLQELSINTENKTIQRFFGIIFSELAEGGSMDNINFFKEFDAKEIIEIAKFSKSPSFMAMGRKIDTINADLTETAYDYGVKVAEDYINSI